MDTKLNSVLLLCTALTILFGNVFSFDTQLAVCIYWALVSIYWFNRLK